MNLTLLFVTLLGLGSLALGLFAAWEVADHRRTEEALGEIERALSGLVDGSVDFAIFAVVKDGRVRSFLAGDRAVPRGDAVDVRSLVVVRRDRTFSSKLPAFVAEAVHVN